MAGEMVGEMVAEMIAKMISEMSAEPVTGRRVHRALADAHVVWCLCHRAGGDVAQPGAEFTTRVGKRSGDDEQSEEGDEQLACFHTKDKSNDDSP